MAGRLAAHRRLGARESDSRFGGSNGLLTGKTRDRLFDELARLGAKSIVVSSNVAGDKLKDDYCVIHEGRSVGRVRLADERWQGTVWTWNVNVALPIPSWCNGSTDSLEAAKDEFKAAWGQFYASLTPEDIKSWHRTEDRSRQGECVMAGEVIG